MKMTLELIPQLALLFLETVLVSSILLLFFRLRSIMGLAPIYTMLGVFFQLANLWSATIYIRITPELLLSPGSVVLFPSSILAVLFIYIREDAAEARRLIYALLASDIVGSILSLMVVLHLQDPHVFNPFHLSPALFVNMPRLDLVGSITLYIDAILIILVYEFLASRCRSLFWSIYLSMTAVLIFDTVVFVTGGFFEQPTYLSILLSGLLGKSITSILYSSVLAVYLTRFDVTRTDATEHPKALGDLFEVLTYRQKYEAMKVKASRDGLTNVYNRAFFNDVLQSEVATSARSGRSVSLLMIDVDFFKKINDTYGHTEGDRVLVQVANTLQSVLRQSDFLCRYGGEEFAVILPGTDCDQAIVLAQRLCAEVSNHCKAGSACPPTRPESQAIPGETLAHAGSCITVPVEDGTPDGPSSQESRVTVTIGVAAFPGEVTGTQALVSLADARLYQGKQAGRNTVRPADSTVLPKLEVVTETL